MIKLHFFLLTVFLYTASAASQSLHYNEDLRQQEITEEDATNQLQDAQNTSKTELIEQEKLVKEAESQTELSKSVIEKSLAEYLTAIQKYRAVISEIKLVEINNISARIDTLKEQSEALKKSNQKQRISETL